MAVEGRGPMSSISDSQLAQLENSPTVARIVQASVRNVDSLTEVKAV